MTSKGPFQPKAFYESMVLFLFSTTAEAEIACRSVPGSFKSVDWSVPAGTAAGKGAWEMQTR